MLVYDVGGGKRPFLSTAEKTALDLSVYGLDIDRDELASAPPGAYERVICSDIGAYAGNADADVVICQAVLEHVRSSEKAIGAIASILKPGGMALLFVPCRNAWYARLNLLLPQAWKRKLLFTIYPGTESTLGFPAYYDRCTPRDFAQIAAQNRLSVDNLQAHFKSYYFHFFFPLFVVWRTGLLLSHAIYGPQVCESFCMVLRKPALIQHKNDVDLAGCRADVSVEHSC